MESTRDRWLRVKELFSEAAARPAAERVRFLADACPDDAAMRREVESLLESHDEADDFLIDARLVSPGLRPTIMPKLWLSVGIIASR